MIVVFLLVGFVPLVGSGVLTVALLERSITAQVRSTNVQLGHVAAAAVRDYLEKGTTKLKSIARMIRREGDPREQARRLNTLLDPADIFLEVTYWQVRDVPEVQAQVQQMDYTTAQNDNRAGNRGFNSSVGQMAYVPSKSSPLFAEPLKGKDFWAADLEASGKFLVLPISVPTPDRAILTANLDFLPISRLLANVAGTGRRIDLTSHGKTLASSGKLTMDLPISENVPTGHGEWQISVLEPRDAALAPLRQAVAVSGAWLLVACLSLGLGAAYFGRRVFRPIRALAQTADALGRGDFSVRTGIAREDEIGQLASAFDQMAGAVQQLDALKDEFVAHVSHELRTPITSAKMAIANVQDGLTGTDSLARVQQDLDRLIRMVNGLLDLARIQAGSPLLLVASDLGALVRNSAETLRPLARVALEVSGAGETIDLDPARIQQIVVNLVDNALKYAKSRVEVVVRGREVRVTDDGPGVAPEHRERVFEKFARVESGPKPPGAGLGLSISRKLARLHGGDVLCEGNTFVVRL